MEKKDYGEVDFGCETVIPHIGLPGGGLGDFPRGPNCGFLRTDEIVKARRLQGTTQEKHDRAEDEDIDIDIDIDIDVDVDVNEDVNEDESEVEVEVEGRGRRRDADADAGEDEELKEDVSPPRNDSFLSIRNHD